MGRRCEKLEVAVGRRGESAAWLDILAAVRARHLAGESRPGRARTRQLTQLPQSFSFGRPPSINLAFVDCEFPKDPQEHIDSEGHHEWGCKYSRLYVINSLLMGCRPPLGVAVHEAAAYSHVHCVRRKGATVYQNPRARPQGPRLPRAVEHASQVRDGRVTSADPRDAHTALPVQR